MKTLTFGPIRQTKSIDYRKALRDAINSWFKDADIYLACEYSDEGNIRLIPNCANNKYTQRLAVLFLIFSEDSKIAYIEFRVHNGFIALSSGDWEKAYSCFMDNCNFTIS